MWRDDAYMLDMLLTERKVQSYTRNVNWERFRDDDLIQNAVMHQIQIIGEAARKISRQYRDAHSEIPWRMIIGMRNRLVHEYFDIIPERVWDVVDRDIPELIRLIEPFVPPDESKTAEK
jgi:uncharacterized protein with HEPN domain